jgi:putative phosphoribosyl transferase
LLEPGTTEHLVVADGVRALTERTEECRRSRPPVEITARTILLIDNGMRTGGTMATAIRAVRAMNPRRVVAATPIGASPAVRLVEAAADQLHCLVTSGSLGNVAMAYDRFDVPSDDRIRSLVEGR